MTKRTHTKKMRGLVYEMEHGVKGVLPSRGRVLMANPNNPEQTAMVAPGQIINWAKYARRTKRRHGIK